jgi:hypothetical protein
MIALPLTVAAGDSPKVPAAVRRFPFQGVLGIYLGASLGALSKSNPYPPGNG